MVQIHSAWREAWSELPDSVHDVMSTRDGSGWFPNSRTARSLFPSAFGADIPDHLSLPPKLRAARYIRGFTPIRTLDPSRPEQEQADRIRTAVAYQALRLERTASFIPSLEEATTGTMIGVADKREALLKLAWAEAAHRATLDAESATEVLARLTPTPNTEVLRRLLRTDTSLVERLERRRDKQTLNTHRPKTFATTLSDAYPVMLEFLDDEHLDTMHTTSVGEPDHLGPGTTTATRWDAVCTVDAALWELQTAPLGLSTSSPPDPAPILIDDEHDNEQSVYGRSLHARMAWLDASIERRLLAVLRGNRRSREGLPSEQQLLDLEVDRSCQPLGIHSPTGRTTLVLGAVLTSLIAEQDSGRITGSGNFLPDNRLATRIRTHFSKWKSLHSRNSGTAGAPHLIAAAVTDPTQHYMSSLWKRIHGHDVLGVADYDAASTYELLAGIARTVTERLDSQPNTGFTRSFDAEDSSRVHYPAFDDRPNVAALLATEVDIIRDAVDDPRAWRLFWSDARSDDPTELAHAHQQWSDWTSSAASTLDLNAVLNWMETHALI